MRLWSLHPKYLDSKGIVALWREGLLAQNVLLGKTKGYKNHPQLVRFQRHEDPVRLIGEYLLYVHQESVRRSYRFDIDKIICQDHSLDRIAVTDKQLAFEFVHLKRKLKQRAPPKLIEIEPVMLPEPHPLFFMVQGAVEDWERV